jgi:molecular chaperone GrpE
MSKKNAAGEEPAEEAAGGLTPPATAEGNPDPSGTGTGTEMPADDRERIAALEAEVAELKERWLRALAEAENTRRRARLDVEEATLHSAARLMGDLLPVVDNLGLALGAAESLGESDVEAWKQGVEATRRQLLEILGRHGLKPVEALGQQFDPTRHEAIMQVPPQNGQQPGEVVEVLRGGYLLHERVLRPALVKVAAP